MTSDKNELEDLEKRLAKDWGPAISPTRKRLAGLFIVVAFLGLIALAFVSVPR